MSNLISSMTRLSTAVTLFTVDQLEKSVKIVSNGDSMAQAVAGFEKTLDSLTDVLSVKMDKKKKSTVQAVSNMTHETVKRTLGTVEDVAPEALKGTTELVEKTRDLAAGWISKVVSKVTSLTDGLQPSPKMLGMIAYVLPSMTRGISLFIPGRDSQTAWRTAANTADIINLVVNAGASLPPPGAHVNLGEMVDKCYEMGDFPALWAVEGLGHYYGDTFYERNEVPRNLLTDPSLNHIPAKSMTMLHAGIGLAFAQQNLLKVDARTSPAELRRTVKQIVTLCQENSRKGYTGCAIESLGLVSRNFHGLAMMRKVDEALVAVDESLVSYLWRGAGRAVYFSSANFIPGWQTPWRAVQMCNEEPPHELGRRNMRAGFAWASTVVNMRHPIVQETILKYHGNEFSENDAYSNGVMSSMIMRYDTSPDDVYIEHLLKYRVANPDPKLHEQWRKLVKEPCEKAINEIYPVLKEHKHLEEVFHYTDLAAFAEGVKKRSKEHEKTAVH